MAQRGRKSLASLAVRATPLPGSIERMEAPVYLSDAERQVWTDVVNDQPAGVFGLTHAPMLEMYCRHVVRSRILADEIQNFDRAWMADGDGLDRYDKLLKMAERESRAMSSLATRLRITRQSVHVEKASRAIANMPRSRKPWELPEEVE